METTDKIAEKVMLFFTLVNAGQFYLKLNTAIIYSIERVFHQAYPILKQHKNEFLFKSIKQSIEEGILRHFYQNDFNVYAMSVFFLESLTIVSSDSFFSSKKNNASNHEEIIGHIISLIATPMGLDKVNWYNSQHKFNSFAYTLKQPFWEE